MRTKEKIQRAATLILTGFIVVGFQNWNYIDLHGVSIAPVNEEIRVAHAKELLGKDTYADRIENIHNLNQHILKRMTDRLPKAYKNLAPQITKTLIEESINANLDPVFVMAIIETESQFNPKARGLVGEIGLMQVRPETAEWIAKKNDMAFKGAKSLEYPSTNIRLGIAYMTYLRNSFDGSASKYVSAYNVGPRKLRLLIAAKRKPQEYATKVMGNYKDFYSEITTASKRTVAQATF
jgi:soluble lytic murein transglycosylase